MKAFKCPNCQANLEIPENVQTVFCMYCGAQIKVADPDDPLFGDNMTSKAFWDKRAEQMNAELSKIPGYTQMMEQFTRQAVPFDAEKDNVFVYDGDQAVKDERLEQLVASQKHLFAYANPGNLQPFFDQVNGFIREKKFEYAYAYLANLARIGNGGEGYAALAGIMRSTFYREPHNDFFELGQGLSYSMFSFRRYNVQANVLSFWTGTYLNLFCKLAPMLFQKRDSTSREWFIGTYTRLFHFVGIFSTLAPVADYVSGSAAHYKNLKLNFGTMLSEGKPVMKELKELIQNDGTALNKVIHAESVIENAAKILKI